MFEGGTSARPAVLWLAVALTAGEFGIALFFLVTHGEATALYLAVTYLIREKTGSHYHDVLVVAFRRLYCKGVCK